MLFCYNQNCVMVLESIYKKEDFITLAECARDAVQMKHIHDLACVYRLLPDQKPQVLHRLLTKLKGHWQKFEQDSQPTTRAFFSFLNGFTKNVHLIIDQSLHQPQSNRTQSSGAQVHTTYDLPSPSSPPYSEVMGIDSTRHAAPNDGHNAETDPPSHSIFSQMTCMMKQAIQACRQWFRWLQSRFFKQDDFQSLKNTEGKMKKGKIIDSVQ
jgi:hypothetical protein